MDNSKGGQGSSMPSWNAWAAAVGTDPGISAELNGGTHMSMEDIGVIRSIPGMVIFEPVDVVQLRAAMPVLNDYDGPVYVRLFRKQLPKIGGSIIRRGKVIIRSTMASIMEMRHVNMWRVKR